MDLRAPADLGRTGRKLLRDVAAWLERERWELDQHEIVVLLNCCRSADRLAAIGAALSTVAVTDPAWSRLALTERTIQAEQRIALKSMGLPFGPVAEPKPRLDTSAAARKAAQVRWHGHAS